MILRDIPLVLLFGGWGKESIIYRLNEKGYQIKVIVTPAKVSMKVQKSVDGLVKKGFNVIYCDRAKLENVLHQFAGAILLSIGFPYIIPEKILNDFKMCLNVHPALLPQYRGFNPGAYVIINNEQESGSTIHIINTGADTGDIVLQKKVKLSRFDTVQSRRRKVYSVEPDLMVDALELLSSPEFKPIQQDETQATFYPKRKPLDSEIDPSKSLIELFDFIRACDPAKFPAYFYIEGQKVCIRMWRPERPPHDGDDTL